MCQDVPEHVPVIVNSYDHVLSALLVGSLKNMFLLLLTLAFRLSSETVNLVLISMFRLLKERDIKVSENMVVLFGRNNR